METPNREQDFTLPDDFYSGNANTLSLVVRKRTRRPTLANIYQLPINESKVCKKLKELEKLEKLQELEEFEEMEKLKELKNINFCEEKLDDNFPLPPCHCVTCFTYMGEMNDRQWCRKIYCPYIDNEPSSLLETQVINLQSSPYYNDPTFFGYQEYHDKIQNFITKTIV
jgi:hypothetical protein